MKQLCILFLALLCATGAAGAKYRVLILAEGAGQHKAFTDVAIGWITEECEKLGASVTLSHNAGILADDAEVKSTSLIIQLDFPPYTWPDKAEQNFIRYINRGEGGWIGFHHATLLGDFDGYPMWQWFSQFMGGIKFQNYVAELCDGRVEVEHSSHPVMKGVGTSFTLADDEWYTYDRSPRLSQDIKILARVDEDSYPQSVKVRMGDHPVVWTNTSVKARNVYFQMGHSPKLFDSQDFKKMFSNAIRWAMKGKK